MLCSNTRASSLCLTGQVGKVTFDLDFYCMWHNFSRLFEKIFIA